MAEEAHDDRQRNTLLVEIHRLGFSAAGGSGCSLGSKGIQHVRIRRRA